MRFIVKRAEADHQGNFGFCDIANQNDIFLIDYDKIRNREGDRWIAVNDVNNKNVTVNYVDIDTKKQVGSLVILVLGHQRTINIAQINDFQASRGYSSDDDSMEDRTFGFPIKGSTGYSFGIDNVKVGGHVNYYVHD